MDKEDHHFNWWALFSEFGPDLSELVIEHYEHYRNAYGRLISRRFPKASCSKYSVNPKRYPEAIWLELLKNCYDHALDPDVALVYLRSRFAYAMPWPDRLWPAILKDSFRMEWESRQGEIYNLHNLVKMKDDDERRKWIADRHANPANPDAPDFDELLAYRVMFGQFDEIMDSRKETAAGLYGLFNRGKLICVERYLKDRLLAFFSEKCTQALAVSSRP